MPMLKLLQRVVVIVNCTASPRAQLLCMDKWCSRKLNIESTYETSVRCHVDTQLLAGSQEDLLPDACQDRGQQDPPLEPFAPGQHLDAGACTADRAWSGSECTQRSSAGRL